MLTPSRDDPDAPDQLAADFYGTVLHDQGRFRMWYYACNVGRNPDWPADVQAQQPIAPADMWLGPVCYAESAAGIRVEVGDERFDLIAALSGENSGAPSREGGLDCPVTWPAGSLAALAGRTVRFRLVLRKGRRLDPRLYAVYLHAGQGQG